MNRLKEPPERMISKGAARHWVGARRPPFDLGPPATNQTAPRELLNLPRRIVNARPLRAGRGKGTD